MLHSTCYIIVWKFAGVESGMNYQNAPLSAYIPNDQWHLQMPLRFFIKNTPPSKTRTARFARLELEIKIVRDPTFYFTILITPIFIIYFLSGNNFGCRSYNQTSFKKNENKAHLKSDWTTK